LKRKPVGVASGPMTLALFVITETFSLKAFLNHTSYLRNYTNLSYRVCFFGSIGVILGVILNSLLWLCCQEMAVYKEKLCEQ
jgi:hypothetical protein